MTFEAFELMIKSQDTELLRKAITALDSDIRLIPRGQKTIISTWMKNDYHCQQAGITSTAYYNRLKWSPQERTSSIGTKNIHEKAIAILWLFYKFKGVVPLFNENGILQLTSTIAKNGVQDYHLNYEIHTDSLSDSSTINFVLYYWRDNSRFRDERVAPGLLRIYPHSEAELTLQYSINDETTVKVFKGQIESNSYNISINLTCKEDITNHFFNISLFAKNFLDSTKNYWFAYTKSHQSSALINYPSAGIGYLEHNPTIDTRSVFSHPIPDNIYNTLIRKRLTVPAPEIFKEKFSTTELSEEYAGIYQGVLVNIKGNQLSLFALQLSTNGMVKIYTEKTKSYGYTGYCRIIKEGLNYTTFLLIDFDHIREQDFFRLRFTLTVHNDKKRMYGIRSGIQGGEFPISGRVRLTKVLDNIKAREVDLSELLNTVQIPDLSVKLIPLQENGSSNPEIIEMFENDSDLSQFFLGTNLKDIKRNFSDVFLLQDVFGYALPDIALSYFKGVYSIYCFTMFGNKKLEETDKKDAVIVRFPINISPDGTTQIKTHFNKIFTGKSIYKDRALSLDFDDGFFLNSLFSVPDINDDIKDNWNHAFGILIRVNQGRVESRGCVLVKERTESFNHLNYNDNISIDESEYNELDEKSQGALSFLRGPVNRLIRMPANPLNIFRPRNENIKRTYFYAGCYLIQTNQYKVALQNFTLAYLHGFAQNTFMGKELSSNYFEDKKLQNDINELQEEKKLLIDLLTQLKLEENFSLAHSIETIWSISPELNTANINPINKGI